MFAINNLRRELTRTFFINFSRLAWKGWLEGRSDVEKLKVWCSLWVCYRNKLCNVSGNCCKLMEIFCSEQNYWRQLFSFFSSKTWTICTSRVNEKRLNICWGLRGTQIYFSTHFCLQVNVCTRVYIKYHTLQKLFKVRYAGSTNFLASTRFCRNFAMHTSSSF